MKIKLVSQVSGEPDGVSFTYDDQGRLISSTSLGLDHDRNEYKYDENGVVSELFYESEDPSKYATYYTQYTLDGLGRITKAAERISTFDGTGDFEDYDSAVFEYDYSKLPGQSKETSTDYDKDKNTGTITPNPRGVNVFYFDDQGRLVRREQESGDVYEGDQAEWVYEGSSQKPTELIARDSLGAVIDRNKLELTYEKADCSPETTRWPGLPEWTFVCIEE